MQVVSVEPRINSAKLEWRRRVPRLPSGVILTLTVHFQVSKTSTKPSMEVAIQGSSLGLRVPPPTPHPTPKRTPARLTVTISTSCLPQLDIQISHQKTLYFPTWIPKQPFYFKQNSLLNSTSLSQDATLRPHPLVALRVPRRNPSTKRHLLHALPHNCRAHRRLAQAWTSRSEDLQRAHPLQVHPTLALQAGPRHDFWELVSTVRPRRSHPRVAG